ncbi:MAG: short-chain dehydrogenase [Cryomorphaceae bacterium]|nr:short-chain dehydrogenase [Cryomorphaceae bacterium]|tara:strand:- start:9049 stop:9837 length:789 start_codon:yes stop_codon:yes gene_type:complete
MKSNLIGKTALVGGSTQGIGRAAANLLSEMGVSIVLLSRNKEKLEETRLELDTKLGQSHEILVADFSEPSSVKRVVQDYLDQGKIINILVNNTGGPPSGSIINSSEEDFNNAFRNHLINNHNLSQLLIPGMKASGYGRIINVVSTSVKAPLTGLGVSNTVRAAVANWSKTLANELAPDSITVNNVLPGATLTERLNEIIVRKSLNQGSSEEKIKEEMRDEIPMQRFAEPEEIARAIVFLASSDSSYITGINLPVDGGRTPNL